MKWEIEDKPAYSILHVKLNPDESITAEAGAFVAGKGDYEIKTHAGGVLKALARAFAGGESVFLNTFIARGEAELMFSPSIPGDIEYMEVNGSVVIQDMSYLASTEGVDIGVAWRGFKGFLTEGNLVWLKAEGRGGVWVNAYGATKTIELKPGEKIIIDNFHFVAMDGNIKYKIRKFGGLKSFIFGGEGIVAEVEGPGKVVIQTRSLPPFAYLLRRFIPSD